MADLNAFLLAKSKLDELIIQFESYTKLKKIIEDEEAKLREDWKAWYHIYSKEQPPEEQTALPIENQEAVPVEQVPLDIYPNLSALSALRPPEERPSVVELERRFSRRTYGEKTLVVMALLHEAGQEGVTPKQLTNELRRREMVVSDSFASNALFRLRKQKKVEVEHGRYVLIENEVDSQPKEMT